MNKYFIIILLFLIACKNKIESPVIYISNNSEKPIRKINCNLPNHRISIDSINPGETRSQSFYISGSKEFFGPIKCSWNNNQNELMVNDFTLEKHHLPSIDQKSEYPYIQFFLGQNHYDILTSDEIDFINKSRVFDESLKFNFKQAIIGKYSNQNNSLISVENTDLHQ